jgi:tetratricopeptide (TPR) repeat protein
LHALNAALLFLILRGMTGAFWRSAVVAALFALHPLRVESVAWVAERKDVLSTLFWMLTVWAYVRYADKWRVKSGEWRVFYGLSLLFFVLGLMSKPMLVTLPIILMLLDFWPLQRLQQGARARIKEKIPFFVLAAASSVVTFLVQRHGGAVSSLTRVPLETRMGNMFISYVRYLGKVFWPAGLSPLYPPAGHWPWWEVLGAAVALGSISAWVVRRARSQPYLAVGWFWFVIMLVPVIGLVQVGLQSMADRYSYVASVGVLIMVVWGANEWIEAQRWVLGMVAALALGTCTVLTPRQVAYWRDSETLFQRVLKVTDNNYVAYDDMGAELLSRGKMEAAMPYFQRALNIHSNFDLAHDHLGRTLAGLGKYQEAANEYMQALSLNPQMASTHGNLAYAYLKLDKFNDALMEALTASRSLPNAPEPLLYAANALVGLRRRAEAAQGFEACLKLRPELAAAHFDYAMMLASEGQMESALKHLQAAVRLKPNDAAIHSNLGATLAGFGRIKEAETEFRAASQLNPEDSRIQRNLARALLENGQLEEATLHYATSVKLNGDDADSRGGFAMALERQGKRQEAAVQLREAIRLRPGDPGLQQRLDALSR